MVRVVDKVVGLVVEPRPLTAIGQDHTRHWGTAKGEFVEASLAQPVCNLCVVCSLLQKS